MSQWRSVPDDGDELYTALQQLTALAKQNSFTIHNVPYDGDCMFSASLLSATG